MKIKVFTIILIFAITYSQSYFTAGTTLSWTQYDYDSIDDEYIEVENSLIPGFKFGIEQTFKEGLLAGIAYTQRGRFRKYQHTTEDNIYDDIFTQYSKGRYNYLTIYALTPIVSLSPKLDILAGAELGMFFNAKYYIGDSDWSGGEWFKRSRDDWVRNNSSIFDLGFLLGGKYYLNSILSVNFNYYLGLIPLFPESEFRKVNHSFQFSFSFAMKPTRTNARSGSNSVKNLSENTNGCITPSKTYGNRDLDNFLQVSYEICQSLQEAQELLSEVNEFFKNPTAFISEKGVEAKLKFKSQISDMVVNISENVINKTIKAIKGSSDISKAAKELKGLDKIKAIKDVSSAIKNLKTISKTAPQVLNQLNLLSSKLSKF